MRKCFLSVALFLCVASLGFSRAVEEELTVFAAASLTDALQEIAKIYPKAKVKFNFAASNLLARQIEEGAPADLFISADEEKMNTLERKGLILPETKKSLLSNSLVVVVPSDSTLKWTSGKSVVDARIKRIALAEPQTVPAGIYAKQYLQKLDIWEKVMDRVIPTENVRAALAAVEMGNVDVAIVYKTDAVISKQVKVLHEVPPEEGPVISYPFAVVKESAKAGLAQDFLGYLGSEAALEVFRKFGFRVK
jgi:molybdate transport system substrate-binding protein